MLAPQITLFQPPSLFTIRRSQSPEPRKNSKTWKSNCKSPTNFLCFSLKTSSSTTEFSNSCKFLSSHKNPDAGFLNVQPIVGHVNANLLAFWLQSCCTVREVRRVHAVVFKFGKLVEARKVFDKMPERNVVSWTAVVNGYSRYGFDDEALRLFDDCIENGVRANGKTFVCVLNLCSKRLDFELGRQIHACIVKDNWRNLIVDSALVCFYAQCGDLSGAFHAFDQMPERDVVCWTTMITACSQQGRGTEALSMFSQMMFNTSSPNEFTVCSVLKACGEEKALEFGKQLHGAIIKKMFKEDVFIGTSLVGMYAKCGEILDSRKVFDGMKKRNTVTWTSIIAGYARNGQGEEAISLFREFTDGKGSSCTDHEEFHAKQHLHRKHSSMVLLQIMPQRNLVSWKAMIVGYARNGLCGEALKLMYRMQAEGIEVDDYILTTVLSACGDVEWNMESSSDHCLQSS
ncbi:unnamed protein product, partial [Vitis vinifera]